MHIDSEQKGYVVEWICTQCCRNIHPIAHSSPKQLNPIKMVVCVCVCEWVSKAFRVCCIHMRNLCARRTTTTTTYVLIWYSPSASCRLLFGGGGGCCCRREQVEPPRTHIRCTHTHTFNGLHSRTYGHKKNSHEHGRNTRKQHTNETQRHTHILWHCDRIRMKSKSRCIQTYKTKHMHTHTTRTKKATSRR